jgi:molybdopterin-guanine dinucleotide biosynthesis protein A
MRTGLARSGERACVAAFNGRLEPVFCLLHRSYRNPLLAYLDQGHRSVHGWLTEISAVPVDFSDTPDQFINLNHEDDQKRVDALLRG